METFGNIHGIIWEFLQNHLGILFTSPPRRNSSHNCSVSRHYVARKSRGKRLEQQDEDDDILEDVTKHSDKANNISNMKKEISKSAKFEVIIPAGEHRLQSTYCLWYSRKASGKLDPHSYDQNMRLVATFTTV